MLPMRMESVSNVSLDSILINKANAFNYQLNVF
jgi:hypothetical protein